MTTISLDTTNTNLIFSFMPETIGLLAFGVILIVMAVGLRWFFNRNKEINFTQRRKERKEF